MSPYCCVPEWRRRGSCGRGKDKFGFNGGGEKVIKWIGYFRDRVVDKRMREE